MPEVPGGGKKRWHELGLIFDTGTLIERYATQCQ